MALRLGGFPPMPHWKDGLVRLVRALTAEGLEG
jgi:hypothetical protein